MEARDSGTVVVEVVVRSSLDWPPCGLCTRVDSVGDEAGPTLSHTHDAPGLSCVSDAGGAKDDSDGSGRGRESSKGLGGQSRQLCEGRHLVRLRPAVIEPYWHSAVPPYCRHEGCIDPSPLSWLPRLVMALMRYSRIRFTPDAAQRHRDRPW